MGASTRIKDQGGQSMMRTFLLVAFLLGGVIASDVDGIAGLTPTSTQTGQLKENQKFLFGPTETKCARHVICKSCIEDISCGWCATSGLCHEGNVLGSFMANCSMWEFAWCSGEPCMEHASCDACISDPLCGWCAGTQSCTEGTEKGPMFGDCLADEWMGEACSAAGVIAARLSAAQSGSNAHLAAAKAAGN